MQYGVTEQLTNIISHKESIMADKFFFRITEFDYYLLKEERQREYREKLNLVLKQQFELPCEFRGNAIFSNGLFSGFKWFENKELSKLMISMMKDKFGLPINVDDACIIEAAENVLSLRMTDEKDKEICLWAIVELDYE
jgi:hypothetical protein